MCHPFCTFVWILGGMLLKYCTLYASGTELQTDDPITRCPWRTFQAGGIKTFFNLNNKLNRNESLSCWVNRCRVLEIFFRVAVIQTDTGCKLVSTDKNLSVPTKTCQSECFYFWYKYLNFKWIKLYGTFVKSNKKGMKYSNLLPW